MKHTLGIAFDFIEGHVHVAGILPHVHDQAVYDR
jgi:hypothetical protein